MKHLTLSILICLAAFTSHAQKLMNATLSGGGATKMVNGRYYSQVIGQTSVAGTYKNGSVTIRQGFKQPGFSFSYKTQPYPSTTNTVKDAEPVITFTAFPNPFYDQFKVSFSDAIDSPTQLSLYDMDANQIFEKTFPSLIKEIDVANLASLRAGKYILYITQNGKPFTITMIKEL